MSQNGKTFVACMLVFGLLVAAVVSCSSKDDGRRAARNSVLAVLRSIGSAQDLYYQRYGKYFPSWRDGRPYLSYYPTHWIKSNSCLMDRREDIQYKFDLSASDGKYQVRATPLPSSSGNRHFYLDETGEIRVENAKPASKSSLTISEYVSRHGTR